MKFKVGNLVTAKSRRDGYCVSDKYIMRVTGFTASNNVRFEIVGLMPSTAKYYETMVGLTHWANPSSLRKLDTRLV